MGVRWLCKHSVHGKKSPLPKGDLVDKLTVQNSAFGLGGTEKKSGEGYCEVFTSRTTRQQHKGFLSYARQLFPNYNFFFPFFFFMFMILQILTSAKEIAHVTWMLHAWTPLDRMYVNVMLDILEMDETAQVSLISSLYVQYLGHSCM